MTDRLDRASTLNFTTIATVRGPLSEPQLLRALRCLEARHPLLRSALVRDGNEISFAFGGAYEIPLRIFDMPEDDVLMVAAASIEHRVWADAGSRAELTWLRHGETSGTLLLCLHHVVSDGTSGMLAMRDLLSYVARSELANVVPLPSPGQDAFFPADHEQRRAKFLAAAAAGGMPPPKEAQRIGTTLDVPLASRREGLHRIHLSAHASEALSVRARSEGATVHGVLAAAVSLAIAEEDGAIGLQRIVHPVDFRRYLLALHPEGPAVGDAIGDYVSAVTTEHEVQKTRALGGLAREITDAVRSAKDAGEPFLSAPVRGPYLVERTASMELTAFRAFAEQKAFLNTYGLSNLGRLEALGIGTQIGALAIEDLFFVAAHSVMGRFGGTAVSFRGRISLQLNHVEPLVPIELADRLATRTQALLTGYAAEHAAAQ